MHPAGTILDNLSFVTLIHFRSVHGVSLLDKYLILMKIACPFLATDGRGASLYREGEGRDSWNLRRGKCAKKAELGTSPIIKRDPDFYYVSPCYQHVA